MVGIVVVSHSADLAEGLAALASQMAGPDVRIEPAGGLPDGSLGTDEDRVRAAIKTADQGSGVVILGDLGSAILTVRHVLERHGMERIVKQLGLAAVVTIILGDQQGLIGLARQLGMELVTLKFSREQETEADLSGLVLLRKAGIAPDGMIRFFDRLSEQDKHHVELFSTHPMSASRAKRLQMEMASLPGGAREPFTFDWNQVQHSLAHAIHGGS